jgi:hypothetical protein
MPYVVIGLETTQSWCCEDEKLQDTFDLTFGLLGAYLSASWNVRSLLPPPMGCVGGRTILSTAAFTKVTSNPQKSHRILVG